MLYFLPLAILGVVSALWAYRALSRIEPEAADLEFLARRNLYAPHVLRIVDSPDYRYYATRSRRYRGYLFGRYARKLGCDVAELSRLTPRDGVARLYRVAFELLHLTLRAKAKVSPGQSDLRALLGVELKLVRYLRRR